MTRTDSLGVDILYTGSEPILFEYVSHDPTTHTSREEAEMSSLVAIHGLNGDPIKTWTYKETGVMWLRDVLPEVLPKARIMTYGYNANFKNFTSRQDLHSIAVKLLVDLSDCRRSEKVG
jgi:hypothetical protein